MSVERTTEPAIVDWIFKFLEFATYGVGAFIILLMVLFALLVLTNAAVQLHRHLRTPIRQLIKRGD